MTDYANLPQSEIQAIADDYSLHVQSFETMQGGWDSFNYLLRTRQGDYVLKIGDEMTPADADVAGRLLLLLAEHDFPAPRLALPDQGGVTTYKGKPVTLKKYIVGQVHQDLDEAKLRQIGAALARLHHIPAPAFLRGRQPFGLPHFAAIAGRNINPKFEAWAARRLAHLQQRLPPGLPQGLIHGDVFCDNVLFQGRKLAAIIDFAAALYYYQSFDLGMALVGTCSEGATLALGKARALVRGYQRFRALKEVEKGALQTLIEYAATLVACWRFWKFHFYTPCQANADRHRQMQRLAKEIGDISEARFTKALWG